jgi:putative redox protein
MTAEYQGDLHCQLTHDSSGTVIYTDAPKDNMGRGESFSPTDLVSVGLAACILTTVGIAAANSKRTIPMHGARASVVKEMTSNPRRIGILTVDIDIPHALSEDDIKFVENVARTCPVHRSLHPDIDIRVTIRAQQPNAQNVAQSAALA